MTILFADRTKDLHCCSSYGCTEQWLSFLTALNCGFGPCVSVLTGVRVGVHLLHHLRGQRQMQAGKTQDHQRRGPAVGHEHAGLRQVRRTAQDLPQEMYVLFSAVACARLHNTCIQPPVFQIKLLGYAVVDMANVLVHRKVFGSQNSTLHRIRKIISGMSLCSVR